MKRVFFFLFAALLAVSCLGQSERVKGPAGALPDPADVQGEKRQGEHEQVVPPGEEAELKSLLRHSVTLLLVLGALMTLVSELSARPAARLFVGYDPALSALTEHAIRLYMLSFFICGINLFASAWFTGLGNGKVSAAVSFIRNLVFELGFVFLLPALLGPDGIWLAVDAADLCCLVLVSVLLLVYRKRYGY